MLRRRSLTHCLAVSLGLCTAAGGQTFKSTLDQVAVPVTISRGSRAQASDFTAEDFRVFDNNRPVPIVSFGRVEQPVRIMLLLDTSRSLMQSMSDIRSAAMAVIETLSPGDTVQVGTFSDALRWSPPLSVADSETAASLTFVPGANMTILYDALVEACGVLADEEARRAIFVVTDGVDTASLASVPTVLRRGVETGTAIYAIGVSSRYVERSRPVVREPDSALRALAADTGGAYVFAGRGRDVARSLRAMIEELHQQYVLGFTPAEADGRVHALTVSIRRPNVSIRARKYYLAPRP